MNVRERRKRESKREKERNEKSTRVGGKYEQNQVGWQKKKMSSNFYECYLIEKRRLSLNRERRQDVYKRKKRKKKKEQTSKRATILCFLNMSLNGCVSFFYGE